MEREEKPKTGLLAYWHSWDDSSDMKFQTQRSLNVDPWRSCSNDRWYIFVDETF